MLQMNGSEPKEIVEESNGGIIAVDYHYKCVICNPQVIILN